ncbi:hypothetical protein C0J52_10892 [Blattella germanica]|nr:hypothetical protein C0J52_10892 [Blattella germanica]
MAHCPPVIKHITSEFTPISTKGALPSALRTTPNSGWQLQNDLSQPLQNTSDTVVIVGGVHWLATQHLHTLLRVLKREGLQQAHLVVKTLGSGFHIPAEGVHYLSMLEEQEHMGPGYHVEGPINAIYTEILLSRLCENATR